MSRQCCCGDPGRSAQAAVKKRKNIAGGVVPAILLILMPKCPACLAAYVSVATGLGIGFTTARYMRIALIALCLASMVYFVLRWLWHYRSKVLR